MQIAKTCLCRFSHILCNSCKLCIGLIAGDVLFKIGALFQTLHDVRYPNMHVVTRAVKTSLICTFNLAIYEFEDVYVRSS